MSQPVRARDLHPPAAASRIHTSWWGGPSSTVGRVAAIAVATLVTVGVNAVAAHVLVEPDNPGFLDHPVIPRAHVLLGGAYLLGVARMRRGRIDQHREWMIRAFAVGLSIATMRLLFLPALVIGDPTDAQVAGLSVVSIAAAFVVHAIAAELLIRASRSRPRPPRDLHDQQFLYRSSHQHTEEMR